MKVINIIASCILSLLFLKDYNHNDRKKRAMKNKLFIFIFIWIIFFFGNVFVPSTFDNISLQLSLFLLFAIYHLFTLIYISQFAQKHIGYLALFLPMIYFFINILILWNKPTYYGAMEGFAAISTFVAQVTILVIFPTFMFSLRMVKIKDYIKGILLILITITSAILGIIQCVGKEGYLSDSTGNIFAFIIILLLAVSAYLLKISKKINLSKHKQ